MEDRMRKRLEASALLTIGSLMADQGAAQARHTLTLRSERAETLQADADYIFNPVWGGNALLRFGTESHHHADRLDDRPGRSQG